MASDDQGVTSADDQPRGFRATIRQARRDVSQRVDERTPQALSKSVDTLRHKTTAEEVQAALPRQWGGVVDEPEDHVDEHDEQPQHSVPRRHMLVIALPVSVALASIVASAVSVNLGGASYERERERLVSQIEQTNTDINALRREQAAVPTQQQIVATKGSVVADGTQVARYQNAYKSTSNTANVSTELGRLLANDAQNARVPWYMTLTLDSSKRVPSYSWEFAPVVSVPAAGPINVMWLCKQANAQHTVLAFAQGSYDRSTRQFSSLRWGTTTAGAALIGTDEKHSVTPPDNLPDTTPSPKVTTTKGASK